MQIQDQDPHQQDPQVPQGTSRFRQILALMAIALPVIMVVGVFFIDIHSFAVWNMLPVIYVIVVIYLKLTDPKKSPVGNVTMLTTSIMWGLEACVFVKLGLMSPERWSVFLVGLPMIALSVAVTVLVCLCVWRQRR
jgi:hypothetical protein